MKPQDRNSRLAKSYSPRRSNRDRKHVRENYNRTTTSAQVVSDRGWRGGHERSENKRYGFDQKNYGKSSRYSPYDQRNQTYSQRHRQGNSSNSRRDEEYDRHRDASSISSHDSSDSWNNRETAGFSDEVYGRRDEMEHCRNNLGTEQGVRNLERMHDTYGRTSNGYDDRKCFRERFNTVSNSRQGNARNGLQNEYVQVNQRHDQNSLEALNRKEYPSREMFHDNYERQKGIDTDVSTMEDAISHLLNIVLLNGGEVPIAKLEEMNSGTMQATNNTLKSFLIKFPKVFEFDRDMPATGEGGGDMAEKAEMVRARTEVKLCEAHSKEPGSCDGDCSSLHICKFFLLSSCDIAKCKFGHDLYNEHNIQVQHKFCLHRVDLPHLRLLLRHDGNRCSVTIPIICSHYNGKGCRSKGQTGNRNQNQKQKCSYLHICQNFVKGFCSFCKLNHNFLQADVHEILCKFGLDLGQLWKGEERVLNMLRSSIASFQGKDIRRNYRGGYVSAALMVKGAEVAFGLNNKIQMRNDNDDIMANIHKIINNSNNADTTITMSEKPGDSSSGTENMDSTDTESTEGSQLSKNISFSATCPAPNEDDMSNQGSGDKTAQTWSICDDDVQEEISKTDMKILEKKYQKYLLAKQVTVTINGKSFEVDFTNMEGCFTGCTKRSSVQRNTLKQDARSGPEMLDSKDKDKQRQTNDEDENVSFENVKDAGFIKI